MISAPARTAVELLRFAPQSGRTAALFHALASTADHAGIECIETTAYRGASPWLMLWGPGAPNRFEAMRRQLAAGGHVIAWDLAYWSRETKLRVSFDAAHPQAWVMRLGSTSTRFEADPAPIANTWNPNGPIIVAGLGHKARVQYGPSVVDAWERDLIAVCAERWRHRPIWYRAKKDDTCPAGTIAAPRQDIDRVLAGASLLITWHSNVAVDAIRMGIPVVCRDGAAAAICSSTIPGDVRPLPGSWRARFLSNLAWFQWAPSEAAQCWRFLTKRLT